MTRRGGGSLALANALARALALAHDLASDLDDAGIPADTLARANALALAVTDASALNLDRAFHLDRALALTRALNIALTNALNAGRASDLERARDLAFALARELVDLDPAACWARGVVADGVWSIQRQAPRGLVALAVWLLPAPQRPRYRAELGVELTELPCRERLGYSVRVLFSAWKLRRALIEAARTVDGVAARRTDR